MSHIIFDIENLYYRYFGTKPKIGEAQRNYEDKGGNYNINCPDGQDAEAPYKIALTNNRIKTSPKGSVLITEDLKGVEIMLPTVLDDLPEDIGKNGSFSLPYSVIRITGSSTIVRTPLSERRGSVKELYNIEDYKITLKGFFIDKENRLWPEVDIEALKQIHEQGINFRISNAVTDIFLQQDDRVVMTGFELPELTGGRLHARPYIINLESDSIFTLEVEDV